MRDSIYLAALLTLAAGVIAEARAVARQEIDDTQEVQ